MRVLLALRGAAGSGKSAFVRENNLEPYVLSQDKLRMSLYGLERDESGNLRIPQKYNNKIYKIFMETLEFRMQEGQFVVVDNTNTDSLSNIKKLCKEYRYRLFIKDFTDYNDKEKYLEQLKENNRNRESYKQVREDVIERQLESLYDSRKELSDKLFINNIEEIYWRKLNLNEYKRVLVASDIHGNCYVLRQILDKFNKDEDFLILLGDYVDRGANNGEVIEELYKLIDLPNVILIQGNHEKWLKKHADDKAADNIRSRVYREVTSKEIEKLENWHSKIKKIVEGLHQCVYFNFDGQDYFATHSAISYWDERIITYSTDELTYNRANPTQGAEYYNRNENAPTLLHGHISYEDSSVKRGKVYNLNATLEFGGNLPLFILKKDKDPIIEILEDTHKYTDEEIGQKWLARLNTTKGIKAKDLGNGLNSYNFDKDIFIKRDWNKMTLLARGLFLDDKGRVIARSYNKFFNFGELSDEFEDDLGSTRNREKQMSEKEEWINYYKDKIKFPVKFYRKENGFLGIVSLWNDKLVYCSKSTALIEDELIDEDTKFHAGIVRDILLSKAELMKAKLKELNADGKTYSMVFEIVDPVRDPHLIRYNENKAFLLDIIENTLEEFNLLPFTEVVEVANSINVEHKQLMETANNFEEMLKIINSVCSNDCSEGRVAVDENNFYFKLKTDYYLNRKDQRRILFNIQKEIKKLIENGKPYITLPKDKIVDFKTFIRSLSLVELFNESICNILDEYEKIYSHE